jgi:DNA-binding LytR/AlgR family response regulator
LAQSYLTKLTQSIKTEVVLKKSSFEDLPFLKDIPKSERKNLLAIQAQQNYIQLIYPEKNYTVIYRLKDALKKIPNELGMKVHRSYWVSFSAIDKQKDASTIILVNGREVPVSRSFSKELKAKL